MKDFENYLHRRSYRTNTVRGIRNNVTYFINWCLETGVLSDKATYTDLLNYMQWSQAKGNAKHTINAKILAIKHYYNYLMEENEREDNPAMELRIRNQVKRVPSNLLSQAELETMHQNFSSAGLVGKRNKIVLGLMIYQGLHMGEIRALEVMDLKLEEGKIYVPQSARSNSRTLKLEAQQILHLQNYILQIRPLILSVAEKQSNKLFVSTGKGHQLANSMDKMMRSIKKHYPQVKDAKQIRASIITDWLKKYNIREVQYLCGHRYVSSTEHYRTDKMESLQEQLEKLHPIK
jgi:site-specific recombinase XerD